MSTIKDLDERSHILMVNVRRAVEECLAMPPQHATKGSDVAELRKRIEEDQRLLLQWAEEKVALASSVASLIQLHASQADRDIASFETDLLVERDNDLETADFIAPEEGRRIRLRELEDERLRKERLRRQREQALLEQYRAAEAMPEPNMEADLALPNGVPAPSAPAPTPPPEAKPEASAAARPAPAAAAARQPTPGSEAGTPAAGVAAPPAPAVVKAGSVPPSRAATPAAREATPQAAQPAAAAAPRPPGAQTAAQKRKQERAERLAAAAVERERLAAERSAAQQSRKSATPVPAEQRAATPAAGAAPVPAPAPELAEGGAAQRPGEGAAPLSMPMPEWAPPGMQHAGEAPQAPGRLLTSVDISDALKGRRAELFWPDDNKWYLILIEDVDVAGQTAAIMYSTSETEQLSLPDIVKDQHMSLITN